MRFDPRLMEARISLGLLHAEEMPGMACDALEAGFDGPATRKLAGLVTPSYFDVRNLLPVAMQEIGMKTVSLSDAALRMAVRVARGVTESKDDPFTALRKVERFWQKCGYCRQLSAFGQLVHDVEVAQAMGEKSESILRWLRERWRELASETPTQS